MAYATIDDIRSIVPQVQLGAGTRPNVAEVEAWIELISIELDAMFANLGYEVPITAPKSLLIVKEMVKEAVAAKVLRSQFSGVRDADTLGAKGFEDSFRKRLERLQDPRVPDDLPDTVETNVQEKVSSVAHSMTSEDPDYYGSIRMTRSKVF
jgi:hypothetical protein